MLKEVGCGVHTLGLLCKMRKSEYRLKNGNGIEKAGIRTYRLGLALIGALLVHAHLVGRVGGFTLALVGGGVSRVIGGDCSTHGEGVWWIKKGECELYGKEHGERKVRRGGGFKRDGLQVR